MARTTKLVYFSGTTPTGAEAAALARLREGERAGTVGARTSGLFDVVEPGVQDVYTDNKRVAKAYAQVKGVTVRKLSEAEADDGAGEDGLTAISGISTARAKVLAEQFGVTTREQLAAADAEAVAAAISGVSADTVRGWQEAAR